MNEHQNNPYPTPPQPTQEGHPPGYNMALTSFIMGICAWVFWVCCIGYIIFAPLGIIFAAVAKSQGSKHNFAVGGLVLSIASIVSGTLYWVVYVFFIGVSAIPWMDFI